LVFAGFDEVPQVGTDRRAMAQVMEALNELPPQRAFHRFDQNQAQGF